MKKFLALVMLLSSVIVAPPLVEATDVDRQHGFVELTNIDRNYNHGRTSVGFIQFVPGAIDDVLVIRAGANGPIVMQATAQDLGTLVLYVNGWVPLFLDYNDSTLSAGSIVTFQMR